MEKGISLVNALITNQVCTPVTIEAPDGKIVVLSGNRKISLFRYFVDAFFFTQNLIDPGSSSGLRHFFCFEEDSVHSLLIFAFEKC